MAFPIVTVNRPLVALRDDEWELIRPIIERRLRAGGRPAADGRRNFEGMRWVGFTGCAWRNMPADYGNWETVKRHYGRLNKRGVIEELLNRFPPKNPKGSDIGKVEARTGWRLECLHHLIRRPRRGRAAPAGEQGSR